MMKIKTLSKSIVPVKAVLAYACLILCFCTPCLARKHMFGLDLCEDNFNYTFDNYIIDFNRNYDADEYARRKRIFDSNLQLIIEHNRKYIMQKKKEDVVRKAIHINDNSGTSTVSGGTNSMNHRQAMFEQNLRSLITDSEPKYSHILGVNEFTDRLTDELPRGYDSMQSSRVRLSSSSNHRRSDQNPYLTEESITSSASAISRRRHLQKTFGSEQRLLEALGGKYVAVSELPKSVDWRMKGVTTPVKNQGGCGSCWAFASTAVMESHIAIQTPNRVLFELSEQQLVSCAPNPQHCGGAGGCSGATAEIAFELIRKHGMVQEWEFGYQEYHGGDVNCSLHLHSNATGDVEEKNFYKGAVATIEDYAVLPSNNYTALMNVVAKLGPVAVSVACLPWRFYQSGVFYMPLVPGQATDIDHLVVLEGYGTDQETGEGYWLVRNSWGPLWGEGGYIRLKRVGDEKCSMDNTPTDGTACTIDGSGNEVTPAPQQICGNSGILFDSVIPLGGTLI